ncbi:unnamed protein product [Caenorhabditis nigoni]
MESYTKILDDVCDPLTVHKFAEMSSLSRKDAISALEKYVEAKQEPVWALYEVSGVVDSNEYPFLPAGEKILKHVVVPGSALDETKKAFEEVISTCLHSIQRTNPKETRVYGRSWADNDDLKGKTLPVQVKPKKTVETPIEVRKEKSAEPEQKPSTSSTSNAKTDAKKSTIVPLKKQANISSMFSKKKVAEKEKLESPPPAEPEKKTRKRPKIEIDETEEPMEVVEEERTPEKKTPSRHSDDDLPSSREQSVEKEKSPPAKRQKKAVNDENKKAKRRLIVPESDEEEEEEIKKPKNARTELNKEEKSMKPEERRRTTRIEKVVETYVDEDGYLVSKEVQKAVECSPQKASPEKPKAKVITAPIPGAAKVPKKNATITSFFKKA